jgi:hypothetical protein
MSKTTTNHDEIRRWAEERGGVPASVRDTGGNGDAGVLRIEFRDPDDELGEVDWDKFFRTFDDRGLAFVYQDRTADGQLSRFNKFVRRERA